MNIITALDDVVYQLTDGFSKTKSVNYLYDSCKKEVEQILTEMEVFDFKCLLNWLKENETKYYKGKHKCFKRIIYALNDYLNNKAVSSESKFSYPNDNSHFNKLSEDSKRIIFDYVRSKDNLKDKTQDSIKNCITYYFLYLESIGKDINQTTYLNIYNFRHFLKEYHLVDLYNKIILNKCSYVIDDLADCLKTKIGSLLLNSTYDNYVELLMNIDISEFKSKMMDFNNVDVEKTDLFYEQLKLSRYTNRSVVEARRIVNELLLFSFYHEIPLNFNTVLLWSEHIIKRLVSNVYSHRSFGVKYIEFLMHGTFCLKNTFLNSPINSPHRLKRQIDTIPLWSKDMADKYIQYRKSLGYKENTICMDCNSIYRLIMYLSNNGVTDYAQITPQHIVSFSISDVHSTVEGKNAYMTRVRSFLIFLYDNKIINFYVHSNLIGKGRINKNIVKTITDDDINKITSREYKLPFEIRAIAIVLLALKCGLRSIDIVNLKFKDISFKNKSLTIIQTKTQKAITLPVPVNVLNAIYNYVKYARPKSTSEYIFISFHIPYDKVTRRACIKSFEVIKKLNGIDNKDYKGIHVCRKTFASNVLNKTGNINITAFSLGHSDNSTVDDYVSINQAKMKDCPLEINDIGYGGIDV